MSLKELSSFEHPYYCSDTNYFSREASLNYNTVTEFLDEFGNADVDMNLVFRWDIKEKEYNGEYFVELFMIQQRKGIFTPIYIANITEDEVEDLMEYLRCHFETLHRMWMPISEEI